MTGRSAPVHTIRTPHSMVAAADQLATSAGVAILALGGNAVDAAIATNAAMSVTSPHLCGLGGDLFALVYTGGNRGEVVALNASGRAGSGASAAAARADGHAEMPFRNDVRIVTVPGCVEGWAALHARFGTLPFAELLRPAIALATDGFPASPLLIGALAQLDATGQQSLHELVSQARRPADRVRRPGVARALEAVAEGGRAGAPVVVRQGVLVAGALPLLLDGVLRQVRAGLAGVLPRAVDAAAPDVGQRHGREGGQNQFRPRHAESSGREGDPTLYYRPAVKGRIRPTRSRPSCTDASHRASRYDRTRGHNRWDKKSRVRRRGTRGHMRSGL